MEAASKSGPTRSAEAALLATWRAYFGSARRAISPSRAFRRPATPRMGVSGAPRMVEPVNSASSRRLSGKVCSYFWSGAWVVGFRSSAFAAAYFWFRRLIISSVKSVEGAW